MILQRQQYYSISICRKLLCEVIGFTLLPAQITELRKEFEKLDVEQSGEISLENLKIVLLRNEGINESFRDRMTDEEVEDIFNSLRLHKADTTVHWHHFLAAGLSECVVDETNHRLAFDKLDHEKKGYIIFEDIVDLTGADSLKRRIPSLRQEWVESVDLCRLGSKIYYDDFVTLVAPPPSSPSVLVGSRD